jgi:AcrR family transcriptional regulator
MANRDIVATVREPCQSHGYSPGQYDGAVTALNPDPRAVDRARMPKDERRAQLLDAASEVFVASGYHAAGMDEIADRAGVSKPVLYQHFPSKLDLYLNVVDLHIDALIEAVRVALESTTDNAERVRATVEAYFDFVESEGEAFRLLFESDLISEKAVRDRLDQLTLRCADAVSAVIAEDTGIRREEAMLLAVALIGNAQVAARYWLSNIGVIPRAAATELVANLNWRGISGFPRAE